MVLRVPLGTKRQALKVKRSLKVKRVKLPARMQSGEMAVLNNIVASGMLTPSQLAKASGRPRRPRSDE